MEEVELWVEVDGRAGLPVDVADRAGVSVGASGSVMSLRCRNCEASASSSGHGGN
jgi:hypothetical protein